MLLTVLSLGKVEYKGDVAGFNVMTSTGEVTVLPGHRPIISVLKKCTAQIIGEDKTKTPIEIGSGFMEMTVDGKLNVLKDQLTLRS